MQQPSRSGDNCPSLGLSIEPGLPLVDGSFTGTILMEKQKRQGWARSAQHFGGCASHCNRYNQPTNQSKITISPIWCIHPKRSTKTAHSFRIIFGALTMYFLWHLQAKPNFFRYMWRCCATLTSQFCRWSIFLVGSSERGCLAPRRATCRCAGSAGWGLVLAPPVGEAPSPPSNNLVGSYWA